MIARLLIDMIHSVTSAITNEHDKSKLVRLRLAILRHRNSRTHHPEIDPDTPGMRYSFAHRAATLALYDAMLALIDARTLYLHASDEAL